MKIAYHFDADAHGGSYGNEIERLFFAALNRATASRLHVRVKHGDLLLHLHIADDDERETFIREKILEPEHPVWTTCETGRFPEQAARRSVYILYLDGIASGDAKRLDRQLRTDDAYLGCLEIDLANPVHWVLYDQKLISAYRVVGRELRLLHIASELEPDLPTGARQDWIKSGLFNSVELEDTGLQETILDPYRTVEAARREAELEELLSGHFSTVASETLIRTGELDPVLRDGLHAALTSFEAFESPEQLAHVATSCRRFLERLADTLFPARPEPRGKRELTQDKYLNRLWAYVEDNLEGTGRDVVISTLTDIGGRIDKLHDLTNKGIHAPKVNPAEMQRLLIGLVSTTYDILTLAPPPMKARMEPYAESVVEFAKQIFDDSADT
ncbi:MAG TPA: hypothetical protein VGH60_06860 [Solirubrobacteraceae bacterium]|jgi:hypothetical protein